MIQSKALGSATWWLAPCTTTLISVDRVGRRSWTGEQMDVNLYFMGKLSIKTIFMSLIHPCVFVCNILFYAFVLPKQWEMLTPMKPREWQPLMNIRNRTVDGDFKACESSSVILRVNVTVGGRRLITAIQLISFHWGISDCISVCSVRHTHSWRSDSRALSVSSGPHHYRCANEPAGSQPITLMINPQRMRRRWIKKREHYTEERGETRVFMCTPCVWLLSWIITLFSDDMWITTGGR